MVNLRKAMINLKKRAGTVQNVHGNPENNFVSHRRHIEQSPEISKEVHSKEERYSSTEDADAKEHESSDIKRKNETAGLTKYQYSSKRDIEELRSVKIDYPLTPSSPKKDERVYAWCRISWSEADKALQYEVIEPSITQKDISEITRIKAIIEDKLNVKYTALQKAEAVDYLKKVLNDIVAQFGFSLTPEQRTVYEYYILRDFLGFGKIQPLMNDPNIEDISCDGTGIPIFVYHRNPEIGSLKANIAFEKSDELDEFVLKLAQKCGKSMSVAEPLLDGALPDGSRVQATLATDVARRGSNFTIRKFSDEPITPIHLMKYGTMDSKMLAYLWYIIEHRRSILVSGPTAAGKTSLLNALSLFIPHSAKIISIEDTPELRLSQSHWVPEVARSGFEMEEGRSRGEVSLFDLLKSSLRQRPDYIIVGEVRGKEAYILFQAMATGHAGLATMHADSIEKVIDRLITKPIELPKSLLETLDLMIFVNRLKYRERYIRKTSQIYEICGYDYGKDALKKTLSFAWNPSSDSFSGYESKLLLNIAKTEGLSADDINDELKKRAKVLEWLKSKDISDYRQFGKVMAQYSADPETVFEWMAE